MSRMKKSVVEKLLVAKRVHFGGTRKSFSEGTIIEVDVAKGEFKADGRTFSGIDDVEIAKKIGLLVPFSETAAQKVKEAKEKDAYIRSKLDNEPETQHMKVIKSDADLMSKEIDIKWTKKQPAPETPVVKGGKMPVIRGDETIQERQARVAALGSTIPKMPIVTDDSLGGVEGVESLNAGQVKTIPNPRKVAKSTRKARKVSSK